MFSVTDLCLVPLITMFSNDIYVIDTLVCVKEYIKENNKGKNNTVNKNFNNYCAYNFVQMIHNG